MTKRLYNNKNFAIYIYIFLSELFIKCKETNYRQLVKINDKIYQILNFDCFMGLFH